MADSCSFLGVVPLLKTFHSNDINMSGYFVETSLRRKKGKNESFLARSLGAILIIINRRDKRMKKILNDIDANSLSGKTKNSHGGH